MGKLESDYNTRGFLIVSEEFVARIKYFRCKRSNYLHQINFLLQQDDDGKNFNFYKNI